MKRSSLFFLLFFLYIQPADSSGLSLGLKAGVGISDFYGENSDVVFYLNGVIPYQWQGHSRVTPVFNCFMTVNLNKYLSGQIELLYSMKGKYFTGSPLNSGMWIDGNISLDYLELPILLICNLFPNSFISPYFYLGPSFSLLLNENGSFITHDPSRNQISKQRMDMSSDYNSFDVGIPIGIGTYFNFLGKHRLLVEIRYTPCLISVAKNKTLFSTPGGKNQNWNISLGYSFKLL